MTHAKKKILIFDMDGVLFDTVQFAKQRFMETHPGVTENMYEEIHSGNFHQEAAKYAHLYTGKNTKESEQYYDYAEEKSKNKMFDGMKDLLLELHDYGYTLILNSNAFSRNCLPLLEKAQISYLFTLIASAEISKNKVEKFNIIARTNQINTTDMLFVTDSLGDLRDADLAGVPTIAVSWGVHNASYFNREKHTNLVAVVGNVSDLRAAIYKAFS